MSKAFDCIDHKLLITKLYSYGISLTSINLLSSYLNNRTQRIKLNSCFSLRHQIEYGVKVSQLNPVRWKHCWEFHISNICRKVSRKLSALGRIAGYITLEKRRMLFKAFIESQFNYCPLIWMLHLRTMNNKINRLHERSLRIVYSDQSSTFEELLERDKTFSIHHKNIQSLAIEIYKFVNGLSPEIMNSVFNLKENNRYSLRNVYELYSRNPRTVKYGTETISYLAPKVWSIVPQPIKESTSIHSFKTKIRKWKPDCPCRLCKRYLQHVGFV